MNNTYILRQGNPQNYKDMKNNIMTKKKLKNSLIGSWVHPSISHKLIFDSDNKCTNAFTLCTHPEALRIAYDMIKSHPGNMVHGSDRETLDGITESWFTTTSELLRKEAYEFKPARRVYIPKANGKMRPLGISSPRDKIIQQSLKIILEIILDPKFCDSSHGFRPNRGCHTALREIRNWSGAAWLIEGDIEKFFDTINHHILESLLKKHINDKRLLSLYWKLVRAGYVEWNTENKDLINSFEGVPQGGIVSPILSNLVLNELDEFIKGKKQILDIKNGDNKPYLTNPVYHSLSMRIFRLNKKIIKLEKEGRSNSLERIKLKTDIKARFRIRSTIPNPLVARIKYVRYADDWLIGVWGNRKYAIELKQQISDFLKNELKLKLSPEKTLITNTRAERARFLSVMIKRIASDKGPVKRYLYKGAPKRVPSGGLWMTAPTLDVVKKLADKGFLDWNNGRWDPKSITKFIPMKVRDIIIRYKSILMGLFNYYSFVDNRPRLVKLHWILKESLRKTLCRKLRLNKRRFEAKFGKNVIHREQLAKGVRVTSFTCPPLKRQPMRFFGKAVFWDPTTAKDWKISTDNALGHPCANCGSDLNIEMHHIKHIKTLNAKLSIFDKMAAEINRKQIPMCRKCHVDVHRGKYKGKSLRFLNPTKKLKITITE